jgi:hypothetical protein
MPWPRFTLGTHLIGGWVVWRSSPYSPTLSYPVVLFLSSTARAVVFPDLGVVCFTNRTALTTWIPPRTLLPSFGPRHSVLFFLALKTGEVHFVVERVALRENFRIFWGIFWYCIIVLIIIIIISFALSCCCSLNYYCLELFVLKWYFWCVKPGLSTCAPFPGSSDGLINKI